MDYHPLTKQITELLSKNNYWNETFEHEPVFSGDENQRLPGTGSSANIRHYRYIKTE